MVRGCNRAGQCAPCFRPAADGLLGKVIRSPSERAATTERPAFPDLMGAFQAPAVGRSSAVSCAGAHRSRSPACARPASPARAGSRGALIARGAGFESPASASGCWGPSAQVHVRLSECRPSRRRSAPGVRRERLDDRRETGVIRVRSGLIDHIGGIQPAAEPGFQEQDMSAGRSAKARKAAAVVISKKVMGWPSIGAVPRGPARR